MVLGETEILGQLKKAYDLALQHNHTSGVLNKAFQKAFNVAKHIRTELAEADFPVLDSEMTNRVIYPEAALWGATPSLIESTGLAARDIAAIAAEVDNILAIKQAA